VIYLKDCLFKAKPISVLTTAAIFQVRRITATDSHLICRYRPPTRLAEIECLFKAAAIAAVDAVMSAHLLIPSWDAEQIQQHPFERISTRQLRQGPALSGLLSRMRWVMVLLPTAMVQMLLQSWAGSWGRYLLDAG